MAEREDATPLKVKETVTVRKFKVDEWTEAQIASGEAEPFEVLTVEDGVVVKRWVRDEDEADGTD